MKQASRMVSEGNSRQFQKRGKNVECNDNKKNWNGVNLKSRKGFAFPSKKGKRNSGKLFYLMCLYNTHSFLRLHYWQFHSTNGSLAFLWPFRQEMPIFFPFLLDKLPQFLYSTIHYSFSLFSPISSFHIHLLDNLRLLLLCIHNIKMFSCYFPLLP